MTVQFPELPGWLFDAEEVSAGVYRAFGKDEHGRSVEFLGPTDPLALIQQCRESALEIVRRHALDSGLG